MSGRMLWVVSIMVVGTVSAACSGTTTGTDLTGNGGSGNGNGGGTGGLLGSVGNNTKDGQPAQQTQQTSPTSPTSPTAPKPANNGGGICGMGESTGSAACDACLDPGCCTSIQACENNPECMAEWNCAKECNGDRECGTQCREEHSAGDADLQAFLACFQNKCSGACQ